MSRFPTTRGSVLERMRSGEAPVRARALETLAEAYWRPVYTYIRFQWNRRHEEAADLTQELFARIVEKDLLARFDPAKARLRTYFRVLVDGLVANELKAASRKKRGGGALHLSLDFEAVRRELEASPPAAPRPGATTREPLFRPPRRAHAGEVLLRDHAAGRDRGSPDGLCHAALRARPEGGSA